MVDWGWWWWQDDIVYTDDKGEFNHSYEHLRLKYRIIWERYQFEIRNNGWFTADTGTHYRYKGPWNPVISKNWSLLDNAFAVAYSAAYDYWYGNRFGLRLPKDHWWWNVRPTICVNTRTESYRGSCGYYWWLLGASQIDIYNINGNINPASYQIYATTIHEIAHLSHFEHSSSYTFIFDIESRLKESWAVAVGWQFTRERYNWADNNKNLTEVGRQEEGNPVYTPYIVDFMDVHNQAGVDDRVRGYSIEQLENAVLESLHFWDFNRYIRNVDNPTEGNINRLFRPYR